MDEKALTYQFGGQSSKGLPPGGQWRCLWLAKVSMFGCATDLGMPETAIANRKAA